MQQEKTGETIEKYLATAMKNAALISSLETSNYSRSARTDAKVSSLGTIVSMWVRSRLPPHRESCILPWNGMLKSNQRTTIPIPPNMNTIGELPYALMINQNLPPEIRVIDWAPVHNHFNARHYCRERTYHYLFDGTNLDIPAIQKATEYLVGSHNFKNLCKINKNQPESYYLRSISSISITSVPHEFLKLFRLQVSAPSFIWHQIRAIMKLLYLVGEKKYPPEFMGQALRATKTLSFGYSAANPLCLANCKYDDQFQWSRLEDTVESYVFKDIQDKLRNDLIRGTCTQIFEKAAWQMIHQKPIRL